MVRNISACLSRSDKNRPDALQNAEARSFPWNLAVETPALVTAPKNAHDRAVAVVACPESFRLHLIFTEQFFVRSSRLRRLSPTPSLPVARQRGSVRARFSAQHGSPPAFEAVC